MLLEQQKTFIERLPNKPYCSDDLSYGVLVRPVSTAIKMRHIQHNKPAMVSWIVLDLDSPWFWGYKKYRHLPPPNLVSFNPENYHCHIYYCLKAPVCRSNVARRKPLRYLAAIEYALCKKWSADHGYSGLISKNPIHEHWDTVQIRKEPWELGELASYLPDLPKTLPKRAASVGLGRNCTLFDMLRYWAYDNVLEYRVSGGFKGWSERVLSTANSFNTFPEPLPCNEVAATANSVAKWVWRNYTKRWTDKEFSQIQAQRGRMGGLKGGRGRTAKDQERRVKAHELRAQGMTMQAIADELSVNKSTVSRWLK